MQDLDSWETKPTTLYYNLHLSTTNYKDMSKFKKIFYSSLQDITIMWIYTISTLSGKCPDKHNMKPS